MCSRATESTIRTSTATSTSSPSSRPLLGQAPSGPTTIDGDADDADATDDRVIHVHPSVADFAGEDFGATGLVIRGGAPAGFGGGISIVGPLDGPPPPSGSGEAMTVGLSLITFTANRARAGGGGGAIYAETAEQVRVINSTISGNNAEGPGGGIRRGRDYHQPGFCPTRERDGLRQHRRR